MARSRAVDVYGSAFVPLPTAGEAAAADAAARETHGVPGRVLMENAGRAAAMVLLSAFDARRVVVLAGSGNNGGDGAVLARTLQQWGRDVTLMHAATPPPAALLHGARVPLARPNDALAVLASADLVVDALLGTGAKGAPRGVAAQLIAATAASRRPVFSLDMPSGVDATTGHVHETAIDAALTVTFGWPKLGLLLQPARLRCGRLVAVEIGFPPDVAAAFNAAAITPGWAAAALPARSPDAHKGRSGRVLLCAGSGGMAGAAIITARAAIAAGAGLVRVTATADARVALNVAVPEAIVVEPESLLEASRADDAHVLAAGPGLGTGDAARALLDAALRVTDGRPAVLDADALNIHSERPDELAALAATRPVVLTPHPAELARLLHRPVEAVVEDRVAAVREAADRFGAIVLLKGQPSLVAGEVGSIRVGTTGSSDVATAGMGDQLTGVIAAMLAAGSNAWDAAALGLFYAGRAADLVAHGRSLTPTAATRFMRRALRDPGTATPPAGLPFVTFDQPHRW